MWNWKVLFFVFILDDSDSANPLLNVWKTLYLPPYAFTYDSDSQTSVHIRVTWNDDQPFDCGAQHEGFWFIKLGVRHESVHVSSFPTWCWCCWFPGPHFENHWFLWVPWSECHFPTPSSPTCVNHQSDTAFIEQGSGWEGSLSSILCPTLYFFFCCHYYIFNQN